MITKIEAENLKGRSFSYELGALTAIVGPNFSGKTAVIEALRVALIGYIPEIGKRASSTIELASGPRMMVCATISSAPEPIVRIFQDGKAAVSGERLELEDLPLLNSEYYFSLTDKERTQYVFERIKLEGGTKEEIVAQAQGLIFAGASAAHEKPHGLWIAKLRVALGSGIQQGLVKMVADLKEAYTYANGKVRATQGATAVLTELKNRESAATTTSDFCQKQIKTGVGIVDQLGDQIRGLQEEEKNRKEAAAQLAKIKSWMALESDWPARIATDEAELKKLKLTKPAEPPDLRPLEATRGGHADRVLELKRQGEKLGKQIDEVAKLEACPYCQSKTRGWKQNLVDQLTEDRTRVVEELTQEGVKLDAAESELKALLAKSDKARKTAQTYTEAEQRRVTLTLRIASYKDNQARDTKQAAQYREEITRLEAIVAQPPTGGIEELRDELGAAVTKVATWRNNLATAHKLEQDLKRGAEAQLEHQAAVAELEVVKELGKFIEGKRRAMISEVFAKLCADANQICEGILPSPLAFHDGTVGRWSVPAPRADDMTVKFIPHRVFSGVEKSLCYVAIAMALSANAWERIVLLDELGRMTGSVRARVLQRLEMAVAHKLIDQAIVVIPTDGDVDLDGVASWTQIEL